MDEINSTAEVPLISEIICERSINGTPLDDRIVVLAALNPYRQRNVGDEETPGLVYQLHRPPQEGEVDFGSLVYKVNSIPQVGENSVHSDIGKRKPAQCVGPLIIWALETDGLRL